MSGRPSKSVKVLRMEGRSHRTKRELAQRERLEEANLTGQMLREEKAVRDDPVAHKEFIRVRKLLKLIEKDDDLYGAEINLYCQLKSEIEREESERGKLAADLDRFRDACDRFEEAEDILAGAKVMQSMRTQINQYESRIQQKRRMRMDIEKNNLMNIAASLRSVPKATEKKKNLLAEALGG